MEAGKFIGLLFQSRDIAHVIHLNTKSFAEHKCMSQYYEGILDLTDSFTEKYFGRNGRVPITIPESKLQSATEHLKRLQGIVEEERRNMPTDLQNILDEILGLINNTLYLLTLV